MELEVNGDVHEVDVDPDTPLVYVLRNTLGLTATKLGCGLEQCGACAVLVDGELALSCVEPVASFAGRSVCTAEGLERDPRSRAVREAFVAAGAAQCGYCTPGLTIAVAALLARDRHPGDDAIRAALAPQLCRCGSHPRVIAAVRELAASESA